MSTPRDPDGGTLQPPSVTPIQTPGDPAPTSDDSTPPAPAVPSTIESPATSVPDTRPVVASTAPLAYSSAASGPSGYEIERELGRGGMGVVYLAYHAALGRRVALKMVLAGGHARADELARFQQEAAAAAKLQHPNVVQVYEVGRFDGRPYFTLEYVEGGSLAQHAKDPLPSREAAVLVEQIARGVGFAHAHGIVHRDLKPENVLLAPGSGSREGAVENRTTPSRGPFAGAVPKITDFGLAKTIDSGDGLTATGAVMGTPSYMAPEQARGDTKRIGPAADVWALGAVLYRLLTGRPPFQAANPFETLLQVTAADPVPPSQLVPKLSRDLETICLKCLRKDPVKRYASADAVADDLRRWQDGKPILARPVGAVERALKTAKRNWGPLVVAAVVFVGLAAGAGVATWQAIEAEKARKAAVQETTNARIAEGNAREAERLASEREQKEKEARTEAEERKREVERQKAEILREGLTAGMIHFYLLDVLTKIAFTNGLGSAPNPATHPAVLAALRGAAPSADSYSRTAKDPLVEAGARSQIGSFCINLLALPEAERHLARALELYHQTDGPDSEKTAPVAIRLGEVYLRLGELAKAEPLLDRGHDGMVRKFGPDTHFALIVTHATGERYLWHRRYEKAEPLLVRAVAGREKALGPNDPLTLKSVDALALLYEEQERWVDAERLQRRLLAAREKVQGPNHPDTLASLSALATALEGQERWVDTEPLLRRVLADREKRQPAEWSTPNARSRLGATLLGLGRPAEAEPLLLSGYRGLVGQKDRIPHRFRTLRLREAADRLARLAEATGKPDEAKKWRAEAAKYPELAPPPRPAR